MSSSGGYCRHCGTVWSYPGTCNCSKVEVKELKIIDIDIIKLIKDKVGEGFTLTINGQATYLKYSQAHLLMLWLQEHLK